MKQYAVAIQASSSTVAIQASSSKVAIQASIYIFVLLDLRFKNTTFIGEKSVTKSLDSGITRRVYTKNKKYL